MPIIRNYQEEDSIFIFDSSLDHRSTYDANHLESLSKAEPYHFWFSARREKICQSFLQHVDKASSILEISGGTGFVAEKLKNLGFAIEMADIHREGLRFAKKRGINKLHQFDLFTPPPL